MTPAIVNDRIAATGRCRYDARSVKILWSRHLGEAELRTPRGLQPDSSAKRCEKSTFYEELGQNVFVRSPKSFPQPFASALGHRDQHNVDDANRAKTQRHDSNNPQEPIHCVKDFGHADGILDRVPIFKRVFELWIKTVAACNDRVHLLFCAKVGVANDGR